MSEINQSSEGLKIPENWSFPERDMNRPLRVLGLDAKSGYLYIGRGVYGQKDWGGLVSPVEYIFGRNGIINDFRSQVSIFKGGEVSAYYFFGWDPFLSAVNFSTENSTNFAGSELGSLYYEGGVNLKGIHIGNVFMIPGKENILLGKGSHGVGEIRKKDNREGFDIKDWKFNRTDDKYYKLYFNIKQLDKQNQVFYVDQNGEQVFRLEWGIDGGFFIATNTNIRTDTAQILRAPLVLDREKIAKAAFSKPPYPKDEKERLVIPWRNIDRIVGASILYSYPPQDPSKK